jgi:hypothetical protein
MTIGRRWKGHINNSKRAKNGFNHFMNAIRKYGSDAFSVATIAKTFKLLKKLIN